MIITIGNKVKTAIYLLIQRYNIIFMKKLEEIEFGFLHMIFSVNFHFKGPLY